MQIGDSGRQRRRRPPTTQSHGIDWLALASALADAVSGDDADEIARAGVRGCREALGSRSATMWLTAGGGRPRLVATDGPLPGPAPEVRRSSSQVELETRGDGTTACTAVVQVTSDTWATCTVQVLFGPHDHVDAVRYGALNLLVAVVTGALSRARSTERARRMGLSLQRHLLPKIDAVGTGDVAVRYVPAGEGAEVGGDWYDVVETRDGRTVLVLGDVVGHSVDAAVQMSDLRSALHSHLLEGLPAALALARINDLMVDRSGFGTCCCVEISDQGTVITSAGHPPPISATAPGHATVCRVRPGPPLGAVENASYAGERCDLTAGDVIVLYSDGLVESRDLDIDVGIERLRRAVANSDHVELEELATHLLGLVSPVSRLRDDVAILVFRPTEVAVATEPDGSTCSPVPTGRLPLEPDLVWRLIDAAPDAIVVMDADGTIVLANERTEVLFGHTRSELLGEPVEVLLPGRSTDRDLALRWHDVGPDTGPMEPRRFPAAHRDGRQLLVDVSLGPVTLGSDEYVIATLRPEVEHDGSAAPVADLTAERE